MILVVEDEYSIRKFIVMNLRQRGYTVQEAETGEDGLAQIAEDAPELLLLDIKLPGMSGWDVLSELSERPDLPSFPVIVCSAFAADGDSARFPQIATIISKPVDVRELLRVVKAALPNGV